MTQQQSTVGATEGAEAPAAEKTRDEIVRGAYSKAATAIRENHRDEFNGLVKEYAAAEGVEWNPKPTKEEKARAEFERLLAENPEFAKSLPKE